MSEPTEYPHDRPSENPSQGISEGYAGDWVEQAGDDLGDARPVPPPPPSDGGEPTSAGHSFADDLVMPGIGHETAAGVGDKLSALLQSAVDDQVHEQRQLIALMTEIQAGLAARYDSEGSDVQVALDGAVDKLTGTFHAGMQTLREQHDAQIAELSQRLSDAQSELRGLAPAPPVSDPAASSSVDDLVDGLAGMRTELRVLPEQVAPFVAQALAPAVADLGRSLESLEESQHANAQDVVTLRAELVSLLPRLDEIPAQVEALGNQVAALRATQAELTAVSNAHPGPDAHEIADIVRKGVRDATRDFVRDYLRDAVREIVTVSTRDTERRITDHVDEAVLALAQALLTRRQPLSAGTYVPSETAEPAVVTDAAPAPAEATAPPPAAVAPPRRQRSEVYGPPATPPGRTDPLLSEVSSSAPVEAAALAEVEPTASSEPPVSAEAAASSQFAEPTPLETPATPDVVSEAVADLDAPAQPVDPPPVAEPAPVSQSSPAAEQAAAQSEKAADDIRPSHRRRGLFRRR